MHMRVMDRPPFTVREEVGAERARRSERLEAEAPCVLLEWDTRLLGRAHRAGGGRHADAGARRRGRRVGRRERGRLPRTSSPTATTRRSAQLAEDGGFRLMDVRVELRRPARAERVEGVREARDEDDERAAGDRAREPRDHALLRRPELPGRALRRPLRHVDQRGASRAGRDGVLVAERRRRRPATCSCHLDADGVGLDRPDRGRRGGARRAGSGVALVARRRRLVRGAAAPTTMSVVTQGRNVAGAADVPARGLPPSVARALVPQVVRAVTELTDPVQPGEPARRTSSSFVARGGRRTATSRATGRSRGAARSCSSSELGVARVLLTTSCTHALELAALLLDIGPGDEVVVPSFTFVSARNAFALRGAKHRLRRRSARHAQPRRAPARRRSSSERTRAIVPTHYAGVGCELDAICATAERVGAAVVEDNAHGLFGRYRGRPLGTFGALAAQSFHETKNSPAARAGRS